MFAIVVSSLLGWGVALAPDSPTTPSAPEVGAETSSPLLTLQALLDRALGSHPELGAFDASQRANAARADAAGSFPHPSAGVALRGVPVNSFSLREDEMTTADVSISQEIPWFGKRSLRKEVEAKGGQVIAQEKDAWALSLAEEVASTYARLWLASESEAIVADQVAGLSRLATLAKDGVESGRSQADALYAQVEVARTRDQLLALREEEGAARARLEALLAAESPLVGAVEPPPTLPLPQREHLLARLDTHPALQAFDKGQEQAKLQASLARKEKLPDPRVGLTYGVRADFPDLVGIEVEFPIPLFASSKEERLAAAAEADAEALGRRKKAQRDALVASIESAWLRAEKEDARHRLIEDEILPGLHRGLEASIGAYLAGRLEFATVVDRQIQIASYQIQSLQARADRLVALARLAAATGDLGLLASREGDVR